MNKKNKGKIAYISSSLPKLTTTFIYREILELREQGCKVEIFSVHRPSINEVSEEVRELIKEIHYIYPVNIFELVISQLFWLFTFPIRYLKVFKLSLLCIPEPPQKILKKFKIIYHFFISSYFARKISKEDISHFHAHFAHSPTNIAMFASNLLGIKFSFTAHAHDIYQYVFDMETQIKQSTFVNVISEYNRSYLINKYGSEIEPKLKVVYYGIDCDKYARNTGFINNNIPFIIMIGRLVEMKGIKYLIESCNYLKLKGYNFRCQIIGAGILKDELQDMIYNLQLDNYIELTGAVLHDKIPEILSNADLFVLPCIVSDDGNRDGIPNVLIEAMALEKPVISTKIVGIPELIEHNVTGLLVSQKNSKELAEAIALLIDNPKLRNHLSKNGREKILKDFNLKKNVLKLKSIFESEIC